MKIQIIHTPAKSNNKKGKSLFCMIMPAGLLAMADLLKKTGHSVEVIHDGMESVVRPQTKLESIVKNYKPNVVAISMQWHHQMAATLETIKCVRRNSPDAHVVVGGMTASFFYREIMRQWEDVDFVIRGDGEIPLIALVRALDGTVDFSGIPNLSFRNDRGVRHNSLAYQADISIMDRMDFSNIGLMRQPGTYGGLYGGSIGENHSQTNNEVESVKKDGYFYLSTGRGCSSNCAWCAGASVSHMRMHGRRVPIFRSAPRIADDMQIASSYGYDRFHICFDPPGQTAPYIDLMRILRDRRINISLIFEAYGQPPSDEFVKEFSETFKKEHSAITLSPETADEKLRRYYRGGSAMSNRSLLKVLQICAKRGVNTELYFALLPGQNLEGLKETHKWAESLASKYGCSLVFMPVEMEPGAPWHLNPTKYGVEPSCVSFEDFFKRSANRDFSKPPCDPGYSFPEFEKQMDYIITEGLAARDYVTI